MENQFNSFGGDNAKLEVTSFIKENLNTTAKWAKFLAIVGFVMIGFLFLLGIFVFAMGAAFSSIFKTELRPGVFGVMYFVMALIYYFPVMYLYKFSNKMERAVTSTDNQAFTESFSALKSHYKYIGILTIVMLSIYMFIFVMGIIGIMVGGSQLH